MNKTVLLLAFAICSNLFGGKRLTLEDVTGESPFEIASLGKMVWISGEDAYTFLKQSNDVRSLYRVDLVTDDTTLFLDGERLKFNGLPVVVTNYSFSQDGHKILIQADREKIWRRSNWGTYWIYNRETAEMVPVSKNNQRLRNVKFSPDGKMVGYVREDNNLYTFEIGRQRERQLTRTGTDVILNGHFGWVYEEEFSLYDAYRWSPNSKTIAYWEENQSRVPVFTLINELELYPVTTEIRYPKAGQTNPTMRIGVVKATGGKTRWMDIGENRDIYYPRMYWHSSEQLLVIRMRRLQNRWDLLICNPKSGKKKQGLMEMDENGWVSVHDNYRLLKKNEIVWISERSGYQHLHRHTLKGEELVQLSDGQWEATRIVHLDEERDVVYFMANKASVAESHLYSVSFDGTGLKQLTTEKGNHSVQFSPLGVYFVDSYSSISQPSKIVLKKRDGTTVRIIKETDKNQFDDYDWSIPRFVTFKTHDGAETLDGIVILPVGYKKGKKYPMMVHGYGMPGTQIVRNSWGGLWNQFLAQEGFIVFSMDARGMSGRGEAFKNLSYGDMSRYLAKDHVAGIDYMVREWGADPDRVGAWGWSGGGYFTGLMLTKNGSHFKAGVSVAPVMDFRLYDTIYTERSMGLPQDNKAGYDSTSVFSYVDNLQGHLLVIHATGDDNVHSQNTTQLVEKFVNAKQPLEVFYYPNRDHGIRGGNSRIHLYNKMFNYLREHLLEK
ncbi:MAG: DPP IV N-terminal domain-containing protein, partial [Dehalococcoidia bacterium]|nr:DPP IV N-terminal domain-containing protein [Dehalococcoidia bacterium]